jgi:hypothetical protein
MVNLRGDIQKKLRYCFFEHSLQCQETIGDNSFIYSYYVYLSEKGVYMFYHLNQDDSI